MLKLIEVSLFGRGKSVHSSESTKRHGKKYSETSKDNQNVINIKVKKY